MVRMEKQNIKVGICGQLSATIATYGHHRAALLTVGAKAAVLAKREPRPKGAFHHQVEHSGARRRRLASRRPATVSHLQTLILDLEKGSKLSTNLRWIYERLGHRKPRCGVQQHLLAMGSLARSGQCLGLVCHHVGKQ